MSALSFPTPAGEQFPNEHCIPNEPRLVIRHHSKERLPIQACKAALKEPAPLQQKK